jgi:hypothetical protein
VSPADKAAGSLTSTRATLREKVDAHIILMFLLRAEYFERSTGVGKRFSLHDSPERSCHRFRQGRLGQKNAGAHIQSDSASIFVKKADQHLRTGIFLYGM